MALPETDFSFSDDYDVIDSVIVIVRDLIRDENTEQLKDKLCGLHSADVATIFSRIPLSEVRFCVASLADSFDAEILTYLDDALRAAVIDLLGIKRTAEALSELEVDDAISVIEELDVANQAELLQAVAVEARADLTASLAFPEYSAGRLMQKRFVSIPEFWSVGQVIDYLRKSQDLPEDFYEIIVINPRFHPVGTIMVSRIMQNNRETPIRDLMKEIRYTIPVTMDQEEVADIFHRYGLAEAPVIDNFNRVTGVITIDDIVSVIKEEEEEDFMRAGGVFDRDLHAGLLQTLRQRFPWLLVNLAAASLAAWVVSQFEDAIGQLVTLAVLMPIVASLTGNGGIQSVTIAVRGIATGEFQRHNARSVLIKEMMVNFLNGLLLSVIMAGLITLIYGDIKLALIFGFAMTLTLAAGGLLGAVVPLILSRLKIDPAIASGVFLTTMTDMLSFFSFLGLASWILL